MKRNISVTYDIPKRSFQNFDNVSYVNIDDVVNHSIDVLYCDIWEKLPDKESQDLLVKCFNKIRLGGQLIICAHNIQTVARLYADGTMRDSEFIDTVSNLKSIFSLVTLNEILERQNDFIAVSRTEEQHKTIVVLQRIRI